MPPTTSSIGLFFQKNKSTLLPYGNGQQRVPRSMRPHALMIFRQKRVAREMCWAGISMRGDNLFEPNNIKALPGILVLVFGPKQSTGYLVCSTDALFEPESTGYTRPFASTSYSVVEGINSIIYSSYPPYCPLRPKHYPRLVGQNDWRAVDRGTAAALGSSPTTTTQLLGTAVRVLPPPKTAQR